MKQLLFAGLLLALISCKERVQPEIPVVNPSVERIDMELLLGQPLTMSVVDDRYLIISDYRTENLIRVFDLEKKELKNKLLFNGRGPREGMPPVDIVVHGDSIWLHARGSGGVFGLNKEVLSGENVETEPILFDFQLDIDRITPLSDSTILCSGMFDEGRFAMVSGKTGEITKYAGQYPSFFREEKNISSFGRGMFHQSEFARSGDDLAVLTSHTISIYNVNGDEVELVREELLDEYEYDYVERPDFMQALKRDGVSRGASLLTSNDRNFYFVFDESGSDHQRFGNNVIYRYDWNGDPVEIIDTGENITCLAADRQNKYLYAIVLAPSLSEYSLVRIPVQGDHLSFRPKTEIET